MRRTSAISPTNFITFGDLLKHLRKQAGLTQLELSIAVGYSDTQISRMEQNQRVPDAATLTARFVPALHLEHEPEWVKRLLDLAVDANRAEGPTPTKAASASPLPRHNLPLKLTSFIGRERQVADIQRLLSTTRLITLTGPGGTGKTRLVLQAAAEMLDQFPDGVWLVEFASVADPALVPQAVAQALALRAETAESFGAPWVDAQALIVKHLRGKTALLLLDNCEHLVSVCAELSEQLLLAAPELRILATSREALGVGGERSYPVPGLSLPDSPERLPLKAVAESEAVRLFVERAAAVRPDFALTDANAASVAHICRRLDGVPLAVELAAARARALSVEQIATLLDDRFRLLTGGSRTASPRQQTLRSTIDWSYELLADGERALLRRLSVFAGGWALDAASQVMDGTDVLDGLDQLVAKSLVLSEQTSGQAARFRMLETIREYAHEKLVQAGDEVAARRQHLAFYLALAEQGGVGLYGQGHVKWLKRLSQENDNLRAALAWAIQTENVVAALRLASGLIYYWPLSSQRAEGYRWAGAALELQTRHGTLASSTWLAKALVTAGFLGLYAGGDPSSSRSQLEKGLAIYRELGDKTDKRGMADAYVLIGLQIQNLERDKLKALKYFQEALDLSLDAGDEWRVGFCLLHMGNVAQEMGDRAKAIEYYQRSAEVYRQVGDTTMLMEVLGALASLYVASGDGVRAGVLMEEYLAAPEELGDLSGTAGRGLSQLATLSATQGDYAQANEISHLVQGFSDKDATTLTYLGEVEYLQGRLVEARPFFEAGFEGWGKEHDAHGQAWALARLGCVAYRLGELDQAQRLLEQSLTNLGPHGWWWNQALTLLILADVARVYGEPEKANDLYTRSLRIILEENSLPDLCERFEGFAKLAALVGQTPRAARLFGAAEALRQHLGTPIPPVERVDYDSAVALARTRLDPIAFDAAWAEGRALSWEQAAAYALNEIEI